MFVSISGIDGCGKTLQANMLKDWLTKRHGQTKIIKAYDEEAKIICKPFIDSWDDDAAMMFLFQALHARQYSKTIEAIRNGYHVVADRWDETFFAYHNNFGFLVNMKSTKNILNTLAFGLLQPDIGFIIDVPPKIARKRRSWRGQEERMEKRPDKYYNAVRKTLLSIALKRKWIVLNGEDSPEDIHKIIVSDVHKRMIYVNHK